MSDKSVEAVKLGKSVTGIIGKSEMSDKSVEVVKLR